MVKVYAHDSGQRYNWAFSREAVTVDRNRWIDTIDRLGNMPYECVGQIKEIDLSLIDENDQYCG